MKKIINGKRYDTETANLIAEWDNSHYGDFRYCEESLYRTTKGNWFIAGKGGPMSAYAVSVPGGTGGGSNLTPLTPAEAKEWLEDHDFVDELEEHFAEAIQEA